MTLKSRVEKLEVDLQQSGAKRVGLGAPACICFPADEEPVFRTDEEQETAAKVHCPLHGKRFEPRIHIYVAVWRWEREVKYRWPRLSEQYHKAWRASFPQDVLPAEITSGRDE